MPRPSHPPAWYPDPGHPDRIRRWDGRAWTGEVRPLPTWLRTLQLSPGPPVKVPRTSRLLWWTSGALFVVGAVLLLALGRGTVADVDRIDDRTYAEAADERCARTARDIADHRDTEERTAAWEAMVDDLRELPVAEADAAAVDRWLRAWDEWTELGHDYAAAKAVGDDAGARQILADSQEPNARMTRFATVNGLDRCIFR